MILRDEYPAGVPCWIDLVQADPEATMAFYRDLFGWEFDVRTPAEAPSIYAYASVADGTVAGVGGPPSPSDASSWTMYVSVASADETAAAVEANGGTVISAPTDIPKSGRVAQCADAEGARFGLWEPAELRGVQVVNAAGSWNFSELNSSDLDAAARFYRAVFGWELSSFGLPDDPSGFFRMAGYGAFLAALDPAVKAFQDSGQGPEGFGDAVAILQPLGAGDPEPTPHWSTTFAVSDADAAFSQAVAAGADVVVAPFDTPYTRQSAVRDPQGAVFNLSEYRPDNAT
jgi:predicted enzyme related to lactoylglutathione lyase